MCGIAAIFRSNPRPWTDNDQSRIDRCMNRLARRGPDGSGIWRSPDARITLAHTRLAIQDLSAAASQPMHSADGTVALIYNGEIYNAPALRSELIREGARFCTHSDTEVLLESLRIRGIERTLESLRGMFAFAAVITNRDGSRTLHAAVDHACMKPLVWCFAPTGAYGPTLTLASDCDALAALLPERPTIDHAALAHILSAGYIAAPRTVYTGVHALGPGQRLEWRIDDESPPRVSTWWSPPESLAAPVSDEREQAHFNDLLPRIVSEHLIGDVPIALFLSAGLDSSAIALALKRAGADMSRIRAFTLTTGHHDESADARALAERVGMPHESVRFTDADLESTVRTAAAVYDQPQGYSALLTATRIAGALRDSPHGRDTKVVLAGDGGDEAFAGYSWHRADFDHPLTLARFTSGDGKEHQRLAANLADSACPGPDRAAAALALGDLSYAHRYTCRLFPGFHPVEAAAMLRTRETVEYDCDTFAAWIAHADRPSLPHPRRAQRMDLLGFCAGSIQPKIDRACMNVGLELRAPFLDRRMLDWALARAVRDDETNAATSKPLLRAFLAKGVRDGLVPESILSRPKQGFSLRLPGAEPFAALKSMVDASRLIRDGVLRRNYAAFMPIDTESREVRWCTLAMLAAWYETRA